MLTRFVSRLATRSRGSAVASRALSPASFRAISPGLSRSLHTVESKAHLEKVAKDSVPLVTFEQGERKEQMLHVDPQPVTSTVQDSQTAAQPFDGSVFQNLTPTMAKFTLIGRVAIITGGGRGLGLNMAQALAEVGVRGIAILDVQPDIGEAAAQKLSEDTGIDVRFYSVDVRDEDGISEAIENAASHFGQIDILINSAGIADSNIKAETYNVDMWRRLIDINVTGNFLVAQAVARKMISSGNGGSIINIASMSGSVVNYPQEQSCYNASKAGVIQMTKSLATEWARYGIRVNAISPGYMDTALNRVPALEAQKKIWIDHTPQKRLGGVADLNGLAVYLASDASAYMTGNNCVIDGGYTLW
ncbi:NAD(P)-binding protein [Pseudovirgaria hyperparasitica]|uniref:NADP-dependent mannitol dehydrogenase n=1 Tax=Pseudovirgaria hyperparasitica TaxID=470096 RepID=A0A6A6WH14_9PEZI|nr:NAD(P)-binding protein [Pseudovirgaria hyperparasitica]KAF2760441.1 NAD(P)-binding protein [Pseudovirgaria hyperparasitica]